MIGSVKVSGCDLHYEDRGEGLPILMIHPSGASASTWGPLVDDLARAGKVITYDRRGYATSGGRAVRSISVHALDAIGLLEALDAPPAVVVGTSSGAGIAIDVAVRRPDLVRAVVAHEFPWRGILHVPSGAQLVALSRIGAQALIGRRADAAETLLRFAYSYREGGSAWDAFPEEWRRIGRENADATLLDFLSAIGNYPPREALRTMSVPLFCTYGSRSSDTMARDVRALSEAIPGSKLVRIEGSAHAAPLDAPAEFARLIKDALSIVAR